MSASKLNRLKRYFNLDDLLILPNASQIEPNEADINSRITKNIKLKIPIVSSPMDTVTESKMAIALAELGAIGVIHRNMSREKEISEVKKVKERGLKVIAAVGPFDQERAKALDSAGADAILTDCAHGHNLNVIKSVKNIKKEISCELIAGNIGTRKAVYDYLSVEPDALRVGIAGGSICTTKISTGVGVPLASAIEDVYFVAKRYDIPIIADGGIKTGGDIVKALALGADCVMVGSLFAGTLESPGKIIDGSSIGLSGKYKLYRGMGSKSVIKNTDRYMKSSKYAAEGMEALVPFRGSVKNLIEELACSIKQGMGYVGAKNVKELRKKSIFVFVSRLQKNPNVIPIETERWLNLKK
jgi:IMP dehydrogenase